MINRAGERLNPVVCGFSIHSVRAPMNPSRVLRARASAVLALALSFNLGAIVFHRSAGGAETPRARRPAEPAGRLPLCFLPNAGQARPGVSFVAESTSARLEFRARGVDLWLRATGAASRPSLAARLSHGGASRPKVPPISSSDGTGHAGRAASRLTASWSTRACTPEST